MLRTGMAPRSPGHYPRTNEAIEAIQAFEAIDAIDATRISKQPKLAPTTLLALVALVALVTLYPAVRVTHWSLAIDSLKASVSGTF